jgi:hypothetical protein
MLRHWGHLGSAGRVPEAWKTGLAWTPQACMCMQRPSRQAKVALRWSLVLSRLPSPVGCLDDSKRRPKKGPPASPAPDDRAAIGLESRQRAGPHGQAITNQLCRLSCNRLSSHAMTTRTSASLPPAHTAGKTHIYAVAQLHPESPPLSPPQASIGNSPLPQSQFHSCAASRPPP